MKITRNELRQIIREEVRAKYLISESRTSDAILLIIKKGMRGIKSAIQKLSNNVLNTLAGLGFDARSLREDLRSIWQLTTVWNQAKNRHRRGEITSDRLSDIRASLATSMGSSFTSFWTSSISGIIESPGRILGLIGEVAGSNVLPAVAELFRWMADNTLTNAIAGDVAEYMLETGR